MATYCFTLTHKSTLSNFIIIIIFLNVYEIQLQGR